MEKQSTSQYLENSYTGYKILIENGIYLNVKVYKADDEDVMRVDLKTPYDSKSIDLRITEEILYVKSTCLNKINDFIRSRRGKIAIISIEAESYTSEVMYILKYVCITNE